MTVEEIARHILREFGCLERKQFLRLLPKGGKKELDRLLHEHVAYAWGDFIGIAPTMRPNERMLKAIEIFLCFLPQVKDCMYFATKNVPFQIFFLKDNLPYFVCVLKNDEEYFLRLPSVMELTSETTLLIGISTEKSMQNIPELPCKTVAVLLKYGEQPVFYEKNPERSKTNE